MCLCKIVRLCYIVKVNFHKCNRYLSFSRQFYCVLCEIVDFTHTQWDIIILLSNQHSNVAYLIFISDYKSYKHIYVRGYNILCSYF